MPTFENWVNPDQLIAVSDENISEYDQEMPQL